MAQRRKLAIFLFLALLLLIPIIVYADAVTYVGDVYIGDIFNATSTAVQLVKRSVTNFTGTVYPGVVLNATDGFTLLQHVYYQVSGTFTAARNAEFTANKSGVFLDDKGYYYSWTGDLYQAHKFEANETGIYELPPKWYRVPITITNNVGMDLTDYQVMISLDGTNFPAWDKLAADGSDIFFTDDQGHVLYHWIEYFDKANQRAVIWVKVPFIPASGSTTIYMYYGGPNSFTDHNDPHKVFIFYDDFEDGVLDSTWVQYSNTGYGGTVSETGGQLILDSGGSQIFVLIYLNIDLSAYPGIAARMEATSISESTTGYIYNFMVLVGDTATDFYLAAARVGANEWQIESWDKDRHTATDLTVTGVEIITGGVYYVIEGRYYNGVVKVCRALASDYPLSQLEWKAEYAVTLSSMKAGIACDYSKIWVNWFYLRQYVEPEPSFSIGSEEPVYVLNGTGSYFFDDFDWTYSNSGTGRLAETQINTYWYMKVTEYTTGTNDAQWQLSVDGEKVYMYIKDPYTGDGGDYLHFYTQKIWTASEIEVIANISMPDWTVGEGGNFFMIYGDDGVAKLRTVAYYDTIYFDVSNSAGSDSIQLSAGPNLATYCLIKIRIANGVAELYYYDGTDWVLWASSTYAPSPPYGVWFFVGTWSGYAHCMYIGWVKVITNTGYYITVFCPAGATTCVYDSNGNLIGKATDSDNDGAVNVTLTVNSVPVTGAKVVVRKPDRDYAVVHVDPGSKIAVYDANGNLLISTMDSDYDGYHTYTVDYDGYQSVKVVVTYGGDWKLHIYTADGCLFINGSNVSSSITSGWYNVSFENPEPKEMYWAPTPNITVYCPKVSSVKLYKSDGTLLASTIDVDADGLVTIDLSSIGPYIPSATLEVLVLGSDDFIFQGVVYPNDAFVNKLNTEQIVELVRGYASDGYLHFVDFKDWRLIVYVLGSIEPAVNCTIPYADYKVSIMGGVYVAAVFKNATKTVVLYMGSSTGPAGTATITPSQLIRPLYSIEAPPPPNVAPQIEPTIATAQGIIALGIIIGIGVALSRAGYKVTTGLAISSGILLAIGVALRSEPVATVAGVVLALSLAVSFAKR